ncbi:MAG: ADP-dependent NAD(P)H-hydrate dehydratase / NAD(P)H-hydrate epimerase, partial [Actinomycetota bacterium]|nr:ADP-dependent NAD(P)H-hydrate dehydratase / NAD(P)H-hydrate epimerase [Actinomycetota bacterium]
MIPVVTPDEMGRIDATSPDPVDVLIARAGAAVARAAVALMGGTYGRRVVVVVGKGNNGADGRAAADQLRQRGVRVVVVDAADAPARLPASDLVIDAAYGTGFHGSYDAPDPGGAPVLAVDIPSGVDGTTGTASETSVRADATVTFAALKPGLLLGEGPGRAGDVEVVEIGLDVGPARCHVVEDVDISTWLPDRARETNKWERAVSVVAGSGGMLGAAMLASHGASRAGAGMVRLYSPGSPPDVFPPSEVVARALGGGSWWNEVLGDDRAHSVVVGPGLGRAGATAGEVRELVSRAATPVVVDADGLFALGGPDDAAALLGARSAPTVLTPHEGEFARLTGADAGADRLASVRAAAQRFGATVLLKGSTTVVADPDGRVLLTTSGGPFLATAGTGDVLSGVIGAFLAAGLAPLEAAAAGAHVHGRA